MAQVIFMKTLGGRNLMGKQAGWFCRRRALGFGYHPWLGACLRWRWLSPSHPFRLLCWMLTMPDKKTTVLINDSENQDAFDYDKGQKSAVSGRCLQFRNTRHFVRRPLKTTFDMTTLTFSPGECASRPSYSPGTLFSWLVTETLPGKSPLKTTRARTPQRRTPPNLKTEVNAIKVDVQGLPVFRFCC